MGRVASATLTAVSLGLAGANVASAAVSTPTPKPAGMALSELIAKRGDVNATQCYSSVVIESVANGKFATAELGYAGSTYAMLRARASTIGPWELYTVCFGAEYHTIMSQANNRYVSAEFGYSHAGSNAGMLRARATTVGDYEKFWIYSLSDGSAGIQTAGVNRKNVSAELGYAYTGSLAGMLRARSDAFGPWEKFWVYEIH